MQIFWLLENELKKKISKTSICRFSNLHQINDPFIDLYLIKQI